MLPVIAIDTETALIGDGNQFPLLTCLSWATADDAGLLDHVEGPAFVERLLREGWYLVLHNAPFDMGVIGLERPDLLPLIFWAYRSDRIGDTNLKQKLRDIATHGRTSDYSLKDLARTYANMDLDKDTYRLGYGELRGVPIDQWDPGARQYAIDDAIATFKAWERIPMHRTHVDLGRQARGSLFLNWTSARGLTTNPKRVATFEARCRDRHAILRAAAKAAGFIRRDHEVKRGPNPRIVPGKVNQNYVKARVAVAYGYPLDDPMRISHTMRELVALDQELPQPDRVPRKDPTEKMLAKGITLGNVKFDAVTCEDSNDPELAAFAELASVGNMISKDLPVLHKRIVHARVDDLKVTGRAGTSKPNIYNFRREPGARECFQPRPGYVYASSDYSGLELCTWSQVCKVWLGYSAMGDAINAGLDPHLMGAAELLGGTYEDAIANRELSEVELARQTFKAANFGFPGGMGAAAFVSSCRKMEIRITLDEARRMKQAWRDRWDEAQPYLDMINTMIGANGFDGIEQLYSGRIRNNMRYQEAANTPFQGLGSDIFKAAGFNILAECYDPTHEGGPLYGCFPVNTPHDEYILEAPRERAAEAADRLGVVMLESARPFLPDVNIKTEPCLSEVWSKDAKPIRDDNGRLVPWKEAA